MRKILVLAALFVFFSPVFAEDTLANSKCTDLIMDMQKSRQAISNVLGLTDDQKKCKRTIDEKFEYSYGENCDLEKEIKNIDEYDKEFKQILTREQRNKLKDIRKMEKSALKACRKNKVFYIQDENLRPFGMK